MALGCGQGLNCMQAHPHLAGRLLHQLPLAFFWVAFHFLGRGSLVGRDRPFPLASVRLPARCQSHSQAFPSLGISLSLRRRGIPREIPEATFSGWRHLSIAPFTIPKASGWGGGVGGGGKSGGEWGWVVGRERVGWGLGVSCLAVETWEAKSDLLLQCALSSAAHNLSLGFSPLPLST